MVPWLNRNWIAYRGLIAASTPGVVADMDRSQDRQNGEPEHHDRPKAVGDPAVPLLWTENSPTRMNIVSGTT